jgi:Glyoxalase-like domain
MELDHVLIAVTDLASAAEEFEARYGLVSVEGGRHPGWGTANRIVPLGETYLEVVAVIDEDEAAESVFGSWVADVATQTGRPLGWAVRTDDLDAVARRLGLAARSGSRAAPDGKLLRWRSAGIDEAVADPSLPFFIEWAPGGTFPGRSVAARPGAMTKLVLRGDAGRLSSWLGGHSLPISVDPGRPAITSLILDGPRGETVIGTPGP